MSWFFGKAKAFRDKITRHDLDEGSCAASAVTVDFGTTHESIIGVGGSMAYYTNFVKHHKNSQALYDAIFGELRPTLLRFRNTYGMSPGASLLTDELKIDGELFHHARRVLGYAPRTLLTSWSPPAVFKQSGKTAGGCEGTEIKYHSRGFDYGALAQWWVDSVNAYRSMGVQCDFVSVQNEPDYSGGGHDCCLFELEEHGRKPGYNEYVFATHRAFRKNMKNPPGLVGPEHTKIDGYLPSGKLLDKLAGVGNHLYGSGDFENPDSLTPSMKTAGIWARGNEKMLFMTEYGKLKDAEKEDCIKLGQIILNAFLHGGVSAYWHWDLFWGAGTGEGSLVLVENPWTPNDWKTKEGFWLTQSFYWFKHFCRFIRPGMKRVDSETGSSDILAVAFSGEGNAFTVIVINKSRGSTSLFLNGIPTTGRRAGIFQSTLTRKMEEVGTFKGMLNLPAQSITTVTTET